MSADDELLEQLHDDLHLLIDQLADPERVERSAIRVLASSVCRKWLVEKRIAAVGKLFGQAAQFPALDTADHIREIGQDKGFQAYIAGGAGIDGRPINSFYSHTAPREDSDSVRLSVPRKRHFTLSKFLNRKVVYLKGSWITTEEVIRFTANKCGGVHFDTRRDKFIETIADQARKYFLIGNDPSLQPDDHDGPFIFVPGMPDGVWDFTHVEMLSVAQSLCSVKFGGEHLLGLVNGDDEKQDDDMLLGLRNHLSFTVDENTPRWMIPQDMQNRIKHQPQRPLPKFGPKGK